MGCGNVYNICNVDRDGYKMEPLPPKVEGKCDACGNILEIRKDDTEEVIKYRFQEYENKTVPLLERYIHFMINFYIIILIDIQI